MLLRLQPIAEETGCLRLLADTAAQNPGLNPALLAGAVERYLPQFAPDFVRVQRLEALDTDGNIFQ